MTLYTPCGPSDRTPQKGVWGGRLANLPLPSVDLGVATFVISLLKLQRPSLPTSWERGWGVGDGDPRFIEEEPGAQVEKQTYWKHSFSQSVEMPSPTPDILALNSILFPRCLHCLLPHIRTPSRESK